MCLRGLGGGGVPRLAECRAVLEIVDMCGSIKALVVQQLGGRKSWDHHESHV